MLFRSSRSSVPSRQAESLAPSGDDARKQLASPAYSPGAYPVSSRNSSVRRRLDHALKRGGSERSHQLLVRQAVDRGPAFRLIRCRPKVWRANQNTNRNRFRPRTRRWIEVRRRQEKHDYSPQASSVKNSQPQSLNARSFPILSIKLIGIGKS